MNRTIYKYTLEPKPGIQNIEVPRGGIFLSVATQEIIDKNYGRAVPVVWAEVDSDQPPVTRQILLAFTGEDTTMKALHKFIGTVQIGPIVYHVYESTTSNSMYVNGVPV